MLACALGAFIGALSALEIQSRFALGLYLWPFGALFGGLVAYCAVDFKQLCNGIAKSYRVSVRNISRAYRVIETEIKAWEPNKPYWKAKGIMAIGCLTCTVSFGLSALILYFILNEQIRGFAEVIVGTALIFSTMAAVTCAVLPIAFLDVHGDKDTRLRETEFGWDLFRFGNPIVLPFFIIAILARAIWLLGREVPQFVVRTFRFVHSERRTLCFIDATLGAGIGFFFGSAILGAIVGAVVSGIDYEIVSVRWLKIVPARTK